MAVMMFFLLMDLVIPSFYESLTHGIGYLITDAPVLKQIIEAQPLFYTFEGTFLGWQILSNPVWYSFTFSFYAGIIGFAWLFYSHRNGMDKAQIFFIVWTLIVLALALYQRRFSYTLAINIAILSGYFIDRIKSLSLRPYYVIFLLFLFIPNMAVAYDLSQVPPKPSDDWYDPLLWLKENTPAGGQYGIMTWCG
ncbi:MAG: hypothetical protein O8C66_07190 [Candidatus Methanoperedens sp.]|nr:hypothetical protein [Candidatus Methanoperedens sp.]MCZ7370278.1 hypothetical protein [Candidatus Methanoperedens sp.]